MKKVLSLALASLMIIAFAQCSGGSQQFKDEQKLFKKIENAVNKAKTCEDLEKASDLLWTEAPTTEYAEKDQITKEESDKLIDLLNKIDEVYESKSKEFGCD